MNIELARNFKAEAAIPAFTILKLGAADGGVLPAAAVADKAFAISTDIPAAIGERCEFHAISSSA